MGGLSTDKVFNILEASSWFGVARADPIFVRHSETKRMRMMRRRSAGPLISKFLKRELARKRSKVSSIMSASSAAALGAGPLVLVRIGNTAVLPTGLISGYSLNDEW